MNLYINRKWRLFFKRHPLRTSFMIMVVLVIINILIYVLWNEYFLKFGDDELLKTTKTYVDNHESHDIENITYFKSFDENQYLMSDNSSLAPCSENSLKLVGRFLPDLIEYHWHVLESKYPSVYKGHWSPPCRNPQKVAIIIPYRNRGKHIKILLNNLHKFLQKQQQDYGIFIVEQMPGTSFNRAMLFNIGYRESLKWFDFNCFVFHDVDLIPENDHNIYHCSDNPTHLSAYIDKFSYRLPYQDLFGGVCAISIQQFEKVNGFSNFYFGWGGEDDDMSKRLRYRGFRISRYPEKIGSYKMIKHNGDSGNAANTWRFALVRSATQRMDKDGLSSLQYTLISSRSHKLAVWLKVQVDEEQMKHNYTIWIQKNFFEADWNYQFKVAAIILLLFIFSLISICFIIICAIRVTPDSYQPLLSNKILIIEKSYLSPK